MRRYVIRGVQTTVDFAVLSLAFWLAFLLRFEGELTMRYVKLAFFTWPYVVTGQYVALALANVPSASWRYVGIRDATKALFGLGGAMLLLVILRLVGAEIGGYGRFVTLPFGVIASDFVFAYLGIVGVRVLRRIWGERQDRNQAAREQLDRKRTLLIGAGEAGVMTAREIERNPHIGIEVVGFVDDDPQKIGTVIHGIKVLGDTASLKQLVEQTGAEQAVITIVRAKAGAIRAITEACRNIDLPVRIVPGLSEIISGKINISRIREVQIEDLLGREAVELDLEEIGRFLSGHRVLVTGAGGSIGSELCRQVCRFGAEELVLVEQAENALFHIHRELTAAWPKRAVVPRICDICDAERVEAIFREHRPEVVIHAAAHKHVPMMEWNPGEAIKNNVFGTKTVADAADRHHCRAFVMISTDKAVNPSSVMGATKRAAEVYIQALAQRSETTFVAVRFGNVLGSAGSVIPIFKEQIRRGGPVTVTHPEMTRYFMTIPEACQLVLQAATMGQGGEIFVLDMGEPVKIVDLARDLIRLSGFDETEISIEFTGARPGEKLFEELATDAEHMDLTRHPKIFIGRIARREWREVLEALDGLRAVSNSLRTREVRAALRRLVPEMVEPAGTVASPASSESRPTVH